MEKTLGLQQLATRAKQGIAQRLIQTGQRFRCQQAGKLPGKLRQGGFDGQSCQVGHRLLAGQEQRGTRCQLSVGQQVQYHRCGRSVHALSIAQMGSTGSGTAAHPELNPPVQRVTQVVGSGANQVFPKSHTLRLNSASQCRCGRFELALHGGGA